MPKPNEAQEEFDKRMEEITKDDDFVILQCPNCDEEALHYKEGVAEACTSCGYSSTR